MKQITKFKRLLSGVLSAVMAISATPIVSAYAEKSEEHFTYSTDDYTVTYSVTNSWSSNYQGNVKIFNNSNKIIHDWSLAYVNDLETTQLWNTSEEVYNSVKFVRNAGYNQDILPNESVEFGFIGTSDDVKIPEKFQLITAPSYVDPSDYSASFNILNDWGTGYTAALTLTNETNRIIEDWFIDFEWDSQVDTVWNAVLLEQNGSHFVMGNSSYNQNIEPGRSVGDFVSAELKITFDELFLEDENLDPVIYYYNEVTGELEEVDTEWDGTSNFVVAKLEHFSKYILLNRVDFNEIFECDFELPDGTDVRPFEFVFIIDSSGSMKNNDPNNIRLEVTKSFIDKMGADDKAQVMAFDKENYFYTSEFISDKTELKNAINKIPNNGSHTYIGAAVSAGLELFPADYDDTRRYIILLTDGISHDTLPTNYEEIAKTKQVQIITIGLGSGVSKSFLETIATNTAPDNQNGLYYFASSASDLSETFTKIEKEVKKEDPYKDSNNDGITDAQTKLFCEGKLKTNTGINPFAGYTYEEIQNDTDGDLDDDGLINGEEVHLDKTTTNSRLISMTSDPRVADYDRDGFNDKQEVKNNTNPFRFNIASGDVDYLTNNEQFLASSYSDDYIHSKALKAQLAAGNALFRFKLKYTQDYEIALSNYFVTAAKVLSGPELEEELRSTMLDYLTSKTSEFSDWLSDRYTFDGILNPVLAQKTVALADKQTQLCLTGWEWVIAVRDLTHDLESGAVTLEECVNNFADINNKYRPLMEELSPKGIKDVLSLDFLFDDLESMPVPASTGKFAQCIKVGGKVMEVGGYVLIGAKGAVNSYNAVASIAAYASIDDQYERSEYLMEAIMEHSDIDEMCDAASNLKKVIEGERSEYVELVSPILSSLAEGGKTYLVNAIVNGSSKFAPWAFAIDAGLAVGDVLWNISDIDEASLVTIALGDAATCLAKQININLSYYENSDYSVLDNDDIAMINNLAQLRICGEDEFMTVMDNYPKLFNLIHKVLAGDWIVDATEEACEGNKNCIIQIMDQSPLLVAVKHYDE